MLIKKVREGVQAAREHDHVRIDERNVAALALPDSHVVSFGKTQVFLALNQPTQGNFASIISTELSVDALSTTSTSI